MSKLFKRKQEKLSEIQEKKISNAEMQDDDLESIAGGAWGRQITIEGSKANETLRSGGTVNVEIPIGGGNSPKITYRGKS